jgi:diketogulonate reductase-like aldo/keto reductase
MENMDRKRDCVFLFEFLYWNMLSKDSFHTLHNGLKMPSLGLGVWQVKKGDEVENALRWAIEAGYRHIDTARIYGNETSVGRVIKESGIPRKEFFVTTKLWNDDQGYESAKAAFQLSLDKLQMDYVDLYLVHFPVKKKRMESWKALEEIYTSGKAKAIGVSNFMKNHLEELLLHASVVPMVNQVEFHPFLNLTELKSYGESKGIALEAYSPLGNGKLVNDPSISAIAKKYHRSNAQIMIRWSLQLGNIVIPKSSNKDRIKENISVFDFEIATEDMQYLNGLNQNLRTCWDPTME